MSTPEPPSGTPGPPPEPTTAVTPRAPRVPPPPPAGSPPGGPPYPPADRYGPDAARWWQNQVAVVAVGLLMLALGAVVGYLVGHSNAKTRTVAAAPGHGRHGAGVPLQSSTVTVTSSVTSSLQPRSTTTRTVTSALHPRSTTTHTRTVTTAPRTTTTHTVTSHPAPKVIHATTTRTVSSTVTRTVTSTSTVTSGSTSAGGSPQTFNGSGQQSLGTIHVASASQLRWTCSGCSSSTFSITNSSSDASPLAVQGQDATSGQANVAAGTYTQVTVQATGPWSVTITPQGT